MKLKNFFLIWWLFFSLAVYSPALAARDRDNAEENTPARSGDLNGEQENEEEEFNPSEFVFDHIGDSHDWHILTTPKGHHVSIYLPVIVYSRKSGLNVFSSRHLAHGHHYRGFIIMPEGELEGEIAELDSEGNIDEENLPLDFSITKNVAAMMIVAILLLWLFLALAKSYRKTGISEPKGIQGFLEPVVLFVRDDIAIPNLGEEKYDRYMPYLLTVFFFILLNNLMGLIPVFPGGANVTGNIAVTFTLAAFTMIIINTSGNKGYWKHIFNTPGVPWWLKFPIPLMPLVELIGVIAKPFALMVRLFANITAGHIIVLSLVSLIFIFKSVAFAPVSIIMVLFMDCIELLVAFLQAYIFTLLSALFIGLAITEEH
ncbi:MAG: F0F1 ATP synthase subunit A [Bacteroidales bacterium]|nr:F0F1 ATP synthase subunit A [Bacteroidales bacterium]